MSLIHITGLLFFPGIDHQQMKDLGEKYFTHLGRTDEPLLERDVSLKEPCRFTGGDVRVRR